MTSEQEAIVVAFADAMAKAGFDTPEKIGGFVAAAAAYVGRMQTSYARDAAKIEAEALRAKADQIEADAAAALQAADAKLANAAVTRA